MVTSVSTGVFDADFGRHFFKAETVRRSYVRSLADGNRLQLTDEFVLGITMHRSTIRYPFTVLIASILAGCGGGNSFPEASPSNTPTSTTTTTTPPTTTPAADPSTTTSPTTSAPAATTTTANTPPPATANGNKPSHHEHDDDERSVVKTMTSPVPAAALTAETIQGNAVAVWRAFNGTLVDLWANERIAGVWQKPHRLETQDGEVGSVVLATDLNGNAFALWEQRVGAEQLIWAARYTAAYAWDTATVISLHAAPNQTPGVIASQPELNFDTNGVATATWQQTDSTLYPRVWRNTYLPNVGWQGAHAVTP